MTVEAISPVHDSHELSIAKFKRSMAFAASGHVAYLTYQKQGAERNVRYEDGRGGSGEERFQFRIDWRTYLKIRPPLSKWLFGIPEQDRSTLEQEARRVAGHSRRIWIKGKGQPNVEEDLNLKLAFIHSLHFLTSRASKHRNSRPLSPVLRAHDLQNAIPGDQRGERRWRALRTDPLFDCRLSASHSGS